MAKVISQSSSSPSGHNYDRATEVLKDKVKEAQNSGTDVSTAVRDALPAAREMRYRPETPPTPEFGIGLSGLEPPQF